MLKRYAEWRDSQHIMIVTLLSCMELFLCVPAFILFVVVVTTPMWIPMWIWGPIAGIPAFFICVFVLAGAGLANDRKTAWHREHPGS